MNRSNIFLVIASIAILLLLGVWGNNFYKSLTTQKIVFSDYSKEIKLYPFYRTLDGRGVETNEESNRRPLAIMIDNSSDARPAVGLENATLVYETIAEGSITRILAIFDPADLPEKIGPVRSLRPYYLAWALESDAMPVHVGGSPEALSLVKKFDNINEFFAGKFFYRDKERSAPHNTFTSDTELTAATDFFGYSTTTKAGGRYFSSNPITITTRTNGVTLDFSVDSYKVDWKFNETLGVYERSLGGDIEKSTADNVVIQIIPAQVIDDELRRDVSIIGSGRVWIMRSGSLVEGRWSKGEFSEKTSFTDLAGSPILFNPGTTWVEILDDEGRVRFNSL